MRQHWDPTKFSRGRPTGRKRRAVDGEAAGNDHDEHFVDDVRVDSRSVDVAIKHVFMWRYAAMLLRVLACVDAISGWSASCPCHPPVIEQEQLWASERDLSWPPDATGANDCVLKGRSALQGVSPKRLG